MHEMSIATAIVDACAERAAGVRVLRVRIEVGQLAAILTDSLRFCFDICAQGTTVEGAELEILEIPGQGACEDCGRTTALAMPFGRCACGGFARIVAGEELRVKNMELA
ncbi:MAG: hydrogenase maturation nickel metallochaperone HypA [Acetobacteraceae bacterium]